MAELEIAPESAVDPSLDSSIATPAIPRRGPWSIAAAASLLCGLFLIVPFFAGLAAIALGILAIREINLANLKMRGKRLAIAGIILGLLNIFGWSAYFKFIASISNPGRTVAHRFVDDLSSSNTAAARQECATNIRDDRLNTAANQLNKWGGAKSVAVLYITSENNNGMTTGSVRGSIHTPTGEHTFQLQTISDSNSNWKISDFSLN